jgi:replicative DNA helicase
MSTVLEHPGNRRDYPNNLEAEQAVLGAVLSNNEAMNHVVTELSPSHFYAVVHQKIYGAVLDCKSKGRVFNPITMKNTVDGIESSYLAQLVANAASFTNIHDYSHEIVELAMRRRLIAEAEAVLCAGFDNRSSGEMSGMMAEAINDVTQSTTIKQMCNSTKAGIEFIESLAETNQFTPTGLERLDNAMGGGLMKGQAYGLDAPAGHGKTMLAGTISHNLNYAGRKHLFICGEMGHKEIHARSIARTVGCSYEAFFDEDPSLVPVRTEGARVAVADPGNCIYQSDPFLTFDKLKQYVANAVARYRIEGFFLDYLQLVRGMEKNGNFVMHLEDVTQWLAAISKQFNIWSFTLSQATDEGKSRWGNGSKMAFTNLFLLNRVDEAGEPSDESPYAWLQSKKARNSRFRHVGSAKSPALVINQNGPHFEAYHTADATYSAVKN